MPRPPRQTTFQVSQGSFLLVEAPCLTTFHHRKMPRTIQVIFWLLGSVKPCVSLGLIQALTRARDVSLSPDQQKRVAVCLS